MGDAVREVAVTRSAGGTPGRGQAAEIGYDVVIGGQRYGVTLVDPVRRLTGGPGLEATEGPQEVRAIMPGRVAALLAREGDEVRAGQGVVVVEAMKMENEMPAPKSGRVTRIGVSPGQTVEAGAVLFVVES